jgi:hypothetical protein
MITSPRKRARDGLRVRGRWSFLGGGTISPGVPNNWRRLARGAPFSSAASGPFLRMAGAGAHCINSTLTRR